MEILIRPISHHYSEYEMGHCYSWPPVGTDAISCTYNMDGFTPMTTVIRALGLDETHFKHSEIVKAHTSRGFRVISHGDEKPLVITTTKTERWDSEPSATRQIIEAADAERCESLCMTHFAFIPGKFPEKPFAQCIQQIEFAEHFTNLQKVVLDVDSRHFESAQAVQKKELNRNALADTANPKPALRPYLILGLGSSAKRLIQVYKSDFSGHSETHNFRFEAMGASEYWLDGFDFDRQALKALVGDAQKVLFVVHPDGGKEGATMATFAAEYAVSQKISVDALVSMPYSWEGGRRTKAANTLIENLRAIGTNVTVVDADSLETAECDSASEALAALEAAITGKVNRWVEQKR